MVEVKTVTPTQVWTLYLDRMKNDPGAYMELPTIRTLQELERMDEVELLELYQKLKASTIERTKKSLAQEFLSLMNDRKTGAAFYGEKEHEELKTAFRHMSGTKVYKYVFVVKRARKSLYYMIYSTVDLASMSYRELSEFVNAVFNKILYLQKVHTNLTEFAVPYKGAVIIAEKFKKTDLQVISRGNLLSLNELIEKKREKARERRRFRRSAFLIEKAISEFFANLFI